MCIDYFEQGDKVEDKLDGEGIRFWKFKDTWVLELGEFKKGLLVKGIWLDEYGKLESGEFKDDEISVGGILFDNGCG